MLKYYITVWFRQFVKAVSSFIYLSVKQMKIWKLVYRFDFVTERIKEAILRYFH